MDRAGDGLTVGPGAPAGPLRVARAVWRLLRGALHLAAGMGTAVLGFPHMSPARRTEAIRRWSRGTLARMGVRLEIEGSARPGAKLLVANHVSWLDILAIHAACPEARFVSKADVQRWPLLGTLVAAAGTLFIERERKRDALRVVHQVAETLSAGGTVAVFPEGTTSEGHSVLPFHANLLQAAIAAGQPVQPIALRYRDRAAAVSAAVDYVGEVTFLRSLWRVACADGLVVRLRLLDARAVQHADRRRLAQRLQEDILAALGAPAD